MKLVTSLALAAMLSSQIAYAGLTGQTIKGWSYVPIPWNPSELVISGETTFQVGEAVEDPTFGSLGAIALDVSDSAIVMTFTSQKRIIFDGYSGGFEFLLQSPTVKIDSVSIGPSTAKYPGSFGQQLDFSPDRLTWTDTSLRIDMRSFVAPLGQRIELVVATSPVPEPSAALLIGLGFASLCIVRQLGKRVRTGRAPLPLRAAT